MFRLLTISALLGAAVAVPYLTKNSSILDGIWPSGQDSAADIAEGSRNLPPRSTDAALSPQRPGAVLYPNSAPLEGTRSMSLQEVFRFDVSREWVYQRWARKSTGLAELGLYGVRVPLVTGTQMYDLAGSLTYYFNANGQVERISFSGRTGDTTQLAMLMMQHYGLQPQPTVVVGEQLFQLRSAEHVFSELRTRPAPVLWANSPHDSFSVELQLQRPGATTPLPPRVPSPESLQPEQHVAAADKDETAAEETAEEKTPEEAWKAYSPRSRIPKEQVENLDRRDRFW